MLGADGNAYQEETPPAEVAIRPFESAPLIFHNDPLKKGGGTWRLQEQCDEKAPVLGTLYLPKWLRKFHGRPCIPFKVTVQLKVEYVQADPAVFERKEEMP